MNRLVLIILPKVGDRFSADRLLRSMGYDTFSCSSLMEAEDLFSLHRPDLVLAAVDLLCAESGERFADMVANHGLTDVPVLSVSDDSNLDFDALRYLPRTFDIIITPLDAERLAQRFASMLPSSWPGPSSQPTPLVMARTPVAPPVLSRVETARYEQLTPVSGPASPEPPAQEEPPVVLPAPVLPAEPAFTPAYTVEYHSPHDPATLPKAAAVTAPPPAPEPAPVVLTAPAVAPEPAPVVLTAPAVAPEPALVVLAAPAVAPEPAPVVLTAPAVAPEPAPVVLTAPAPAPEPAPLAEPEPDLMQPVPLNPSQRVAAVSPLPVQDPEPMDHEPLARESLSDSVSGLSADQNGRSRLHNAPTVIIPPPQQAAVPLPPSPASASGVRPVSQAPAQPIPPTRPRQGTMARLASRRLTILFLVALVAFAFAALVFSRGGVTETWRWLRGVATDDDVATSVAMDRSAQKLEPHSSTREDEVAVPLVPPPKTMDRDPEPPALMALPKFRTTRQQAPAVREDVEESGSGDINLEKGLNLGRRMLAKGNNMAAAEAFNRLRVAYPAAAEPLYWMGETYLKMGRFPEAKKEFDTALRLDNSFALAYYRLGYMAEYGGDLKTARQMYQRYLELAPSGNRADEVREILREL